MLPLAPRSSSGYGGRCSHEKCKMFRVHSSERKPLAERFEQVKNAGRASRAQPAPSTCVCPIEGTYNAPRDVERGSTGFERSTCRSERACSNSRSSMQCCRGIYLTCLCSSSASYSAVLFGVQYDTYVVLYSIYGLRYTYTFV